MTYLSGEITTLKVSKEKININRRNIVDISEDKRLREITPPASVSAAEQAHQKWVDEEFPKIYETSDQNSKKMASIINSKTNIPNNKIDKMQPLFMESSIKIANIFAYDVNIQDIDEVNRKIQEVNNWKDREIRSILSSNEYNEYKKIDWMKSIKLFGK